MTISIEPIIYWLSQLNIFLCSNILICIKYPSTKRYEDHMAGKSTRNYAALSGNLMTFYEGEERPLALLSYPIHFVTLERFKFGRQFLNEYSQRCGPNVNN